MVTAYYCATLKLRKKKKEGKKKREGIVSFGEFEGFMRISLARFFLLRSMKHFSSTFFYKIKCTFAYQNDIDIPI